MDIYDELTKRLPPEDVETIEYYERALCTLYGKRWARESTKGFALRSTLVDMWTSARARGERVLEDY